MHIPTCILSVHTYIYIYARMCVCALYGCIGKPKAEPTPAPPRHSRALRLLRRGARRRRSGPKRRRLDGTGWGLLAASGYICTCMCVLCLFLQELFLYRSMNLYYDIHICICMYIYVCKIVYIYVPLKEPLNQICLGAQPSRAALFFFALGLCSSCALVLEILVYKASQADTQTPGWIQQVDPP